MDLERLSHRYLTDAFHRSDASFAVTSPVDGRTVAHVADCGVEVADTAARLAWEAFHTWRTTTAFARGEILERWYALLMDRADAIARTITAEMGKPVREARGEVAYAAGFVSWYAHEAPRAYGSIVPLAAPSKRGLVLRKPVGPVYAVTPWNFPAAMVTRKCAPALAAGCTVILKPAEQTPLTALLLAEAWLDAGGPPGTLQVLPVRDPVPITDRFMHDPRIRKVAFTGSTEVGRILYRASAETIKKLSLELGGHAPFLVFDDADLDHAVRETIACKFRNAGQTCVCTNRIFVHANVAAEFTERYVAAASALTIGDPFDEATDVGPLVDGAGLAKVEEHVRDAVDRGATVHLGGRRGDGLTYLPTVLGDVTDEMLLMREETFGPVAPIATFDDEDEVVDRANATPYGLAAYAYTRDLARTFRLAERLEYGIVGINDGVPSVPYAPFGGTKQSGLGREGGPWGLEEFEEITYVSLGLPR